MVISIESVFTIQYVDLTLNSWQKSLSLHWLGGVNQ